MTKATESCVNWNVTQAFLTQKPSSQTARMYLLPLWLEGTLGTIQFHLQHRNAFCNTPGNAPSDSIIPCLGIYCPLRPDPLSRQLYLYLLSGSIMIFTFIILNYSLVSFL